MQPYLPQNQSSTLCSQNQDIAVLPSRNRNTAYPLRKRNCCFLISFLSAIHMDDRLFRLGCEHMRRTDCQTITHCRAFLEGGAQRRCRLKLLNTDSNVSQRGGRGRFGRRRRRCNEALGEHEVLQESKSNSVNQLA